MTARRAAAAQFASFRPVGLATLALALLALFGASAGAKDKCKADAGDLIVNCP